MPQLDSERIELEKEEDCLYKRIFLDYSWGVGSNKIYTEQEIENAKASPSFEREYCLKYLGGIGNIFSSKDIDSAIQKGLSLLQQQQQQYNNPATAAEG
jgi:hypothetical protein